MTSQKGQHISIGLVVLGPMWERVDKRFRGLYLTEPEAAALNAASRAV